MIYLDNGATSFPKPECVYRATEEILRGYCANPGRSVHDLAQRCAEEIYDTRCAVSDFFSLKGPERVCFASNATDALNTVIKGVIKPGFTVFTTDAEHNSVLRPLYKLRDTIGVDLRIFPADMDIYESIKTSQPIKPSVLVINLRSNVTGQTQDLNTIKRIKDEFGITVIADASQLAGHENIDASMGFADFICTSGHKGLFGIQGTGLLLINSELKIDTLREGGTGTETFNPSMPEFIPDRFEAGTQNVPGILSIYHGISFLNEYGMDSVKGRINELTEMLYERLSSVRGVRILGCEGGISAFTLGKHNSEYVGTKLNEDGICVRCGYHCAPLIHDRLRTKSSGAVRVSLSVFNRKYHLDRLYSSLKRIAEQTI